MPSANVPAKIDIARQFELALQASSSDELDVSFLHSSFCLSGLPLRPLVARAQTPTDETIPTTDGRRKELTHFHRHGSSCSLSINSPILELPASRRQVSIGLPWGARARLLVLWVTTAAQAQHDGNRFLEIGSIRSWMDDVGVPYCLASINAIKEQMVRLSFARFTMLMNHGGSQFFRDDCLFEGGVFEDQDLENYADNNMTAVRMPIGLKLSVNAYNGFTGRDAIPIPTQALRGISNNSMAIDIFVYLCFKLRSIPENDTLMITWKTLVSQFGNGESRSKFIQAFRPSIQRALEALTCATADIDDEGLRLHHVRPAEYRKLFVVPAKEPRITRTRLTNRIVPAKAAQISMEL